MPAQGIVTTAKASVANDCLDTVLAIWREVLVPGSGVARQLDADSNFFLCGGDSLDLMRVLVRVRERFLVSLDMRAVGTFCTPRRMAQCCARAVAATGEPAATTQTRQVHAASAAGEAGLPTSFASNAGQHALWLAEQLGNCCGLYNTAAAIHFSGALQVPLLARALALLLHRHEILRGSFRPDLHARHLVVHIAAPADIALEAEPVRQDDLHQLLRDIAAQPFDLAHGPLWRFRLLCTGAQRWTLLFCLHHAVTDGWSGSVLLRNLTEHYRALAQGGNEASATPARNTAPARGDTLAATTVLAKDTTLVQDRAQRGLVIDTEFRQWCQQAALHSDADLRWWRSYLANADRLPSWPPTGTTRWPFTMSLEACALPRGMLDDLQCVSRSQGLRPAVLFLTALRLAVLDVGGVDELCIGMPVNVRDGSAQDEAVGYFVNLLVLRGRIGGLHCGLDAVREIQLALDNALRHRAVPFTELARTLKPLPLPSGNAWCDLLFAFQNLPWAEPDFGDLSARVEALTLPRGQHPLKVEVLWATNSCTCRIEYARECLGQADARALLEALRHQLARLVAPGAARSS
jgi:aryl carrier-like protein